MAKKKNKVKSGSRSARAVKATPKTSARPGRRRKDASKSVAVPVFDPSSALDAPHIREKIARIKMLILDVDGVLTDATLFHIEGTGWVRRYNVRDGYGMKLLMRAGIEVGVISAGQSEGILKRMELLGVQHVYTGSEDKTVAFKKILQDTGFSPDEVAYVGDELFDLPILEQVGFSATVPDAVPEVLKRVDYITEHRGGDGAVREIADAIRRVQKLEPRFE